MKEVLEILERLERAGFEACLVGGSVRDMLLGRSPKDFDIATSASPEQVSRLFRRVIPTGAAHGTVTVLLGEQAIEVTTYRRDVDCDGRHAIVAPTAHLEVDLARRDFTVNSMALFPRSDRLVDPFGGRADLELGLIRCVGEPAKRFSEDHLRLLRAVRFAAQLDFEIEPATWAAVKELAPALDRISRERVADELWALLAGPAAARGVRLLDEAGLLAGILPELHATHGVPQPQKWHHLDVFEHSWLAFCHAIERTADPVTRLATLLHDIGKPETLSREDDSIHFHRHEAVGARMIPEMVARARLASSRRVRLDARQLIERLEVLIELHLRPHELAGARPPTLRRLVRAAGPYLEELLLVARCDRLAHRVPDISRLDALCEALKAIEPAAELRKLQCPLRGEEIMQLLGIPAGPAVGAAKQAVLDAILDGALKSDPAAAREWLLGHASELAGRLGNRPEKS
ncbi:MAG: CCA tRNA nucleotidyltransferase [Candidatus Riflebacteria bacterium]|nr:CCA tRNA nucleotidyltransferase [Candidatus Riflebacteria bacterium]